ncbi:MAG: HAMP domain-containing protein, partial [Gammaproteobacteria bacterium]|nr:HAMP domain-containing protein [Gammaproteobacteria bacterium]NIY19040.1 HAMP domain-containing protein [Gammaproteobacteria bacterium]
MHKQLSVQKKMTAIIFLISMLVMLLTSLQFVFFELKRTQDFAKDDLNSLAKVISSNSSLPMALKDHVAMQEILNSLGSRKDVASAYLLSGNGQALVSYTAPEISSRLSSDEEIEFLEQESAQIEEGKQAGTEMTWQENGRLSHFRPVFYEGNLVGYSYLSFETSALSEQNIYLLLGWLLSMGAAVIVTFLLSSRLQKHITAPIEELASRMRQISLEKRLLDPEVHESKDEFGQLFEGFDEMIKALKERDQLLEKHRQELELEVQVRTRALEAEKERAEQATLAKSKFL